MATAASLFIFVIALHVVHHAGALPSGSAKVKSSSGGSYLVANGTHLLDVDLKSKSVRVLQSTGGGNVISIHFNANMSQVFICNNQTKEILSTGVNYGDLMAVTVKMDSTTKLLACAVDWTRQQLYWISFKKGDSQLVRSDFSGKNSKTIHKDKDYMKVQSIAVDPSVTDKTVLYYAGHKDVGKVEIDQQDKATRTKNIVGSNDNNDRPLSLALDDAARKLYWIDSNDDGVYLFDLKTKTSDAVLQAGRPLAIAADQMTVAVIESAAIRTVNTSSSKKFVLVGNIPGLGRDLTAIAPYRTTTVAPTSSLPVKATSNSVTHQPATTNGKSTASSPTNRPTLHATAQDKSASKSPTNQTITGQKTDGKSTSKVPIKPTAQSSQTETPRLPASKGTTEDGKSTSKVSNKPTAQSSQTGTPRLTASKGTTEDGQSTSKVSNKPTDPSSQTETPRLVSGGTKAAPEPEISKGVSSPTTNAVGKPTDGEGNPAEPASSQVFTCECQNAGSCVEVEGQSVCECREGYEGDLCEICAENSLGCEPTDSIADGQEQSAANDEVNAAGKTSPLSMYVGVGVAVPVLIAVVVVLVVVLRRRSKKVSGKTTTDSANVWANPTYDEVNAGGTAKTNPSYDVSILSTVTPQLASESVQVPAFDDQVYEEIPADKINGAAENLDDYQEADDFYRGDGQTAAENYESPTSVCATKPPSEDVEKRKAENDYYLSPAASVVAQTHAAGDNVYDNGRDLLASTESRTDVTGQDRPLPDEPVYDN